MRLTKLIEELEKKVYKRETIQCFDGISYYLGLCSKNRKYIRLEVDYDPDYEEEILDLPVGTEYVPDLDRMECVGVFFECPISYPSKSSEDETGIYIGDVDNYFWRGFDLFENPSKFRNEVIRLHLDNTDYVEKNFTPILKKYDFYNDYDSLWDIEEKFSSTPSFSWRYKFDEHISIYFETDPITKDFIVSGEVWDKSKDFENWLIKTVIKDSFGDIKPEFMRFFSDDPKWTVQSATEIRKAYCNLKRTMRGEDPEYEVDLNHIPDSEIEILMRLKKKEL